MPGVSSTGGGPRNRAYFGAKRASGGGAGPTLTARLEMGPDFGEGAGNDDTTMTGTSALLPLDTLELVANLTDASALSLDALALAADLSDTGVIDFQQLGLDGALSSVNQIDVLETLVDYNLHVSSSTLVWDEYTLTGDLSDSNVLDLVELALEGDLDSAGVSGSFNAFDSAKRHEYAISDILYTPLAMNLREDTPDSQTTALYGGTTFGGTNPFLIRPETIATVTNDERVAYFKWDLTGFWGDVSGAEIQFFFELTNPSVATEANITFAFRRHTVDPWPTSPYSWNNYEPVTVGNSLGSLIVSVPAGTTGIFQLQKSLTPGEVGNWVYCKVTSDLTGLQVQIRTRDVDGNPQTVPHEAPHLDYQVFPRR